MDFVLWLEIYGHNKGQSIVQPIDISLCYPYQGLPTVMDFRENEYKKDLLDVYIHYRSFELARETTVLEYQGQLSKPLYTPEDEHTPIHIYQRYTELNHDIANITIDISLT